MKIVISYYKNFILYCLLLDAEFLKFADKLLFRFENLYCYETARGDRYKFLAEAIIKSLWPDCRALYFNCNDLYFEYKFIDDNVPAKAISEINPESAVISGGADKAVQTEAINNRRTFADEIAYLMGGAVVMVKSDAAEAEAESEAEADDEESSEDLNLENENNDGDE